jgi:hypothetical protein
MLAAPLRGSAAPAIAAITKAPGASRSGLKSPREFGPAELKNAAPPSAGDGSTGSSSTLTSAPE